MINFTQKKVSLSQDHMKRVAKTTAVQAIEELIWNSLDADATQVSVRITSTDMGNHSIVVEDNGEGLSLLRAEGHLTYIGNSWKKTYNETSSGRPIHGHKGEGRFKSFTLGRIVEWRSIYQKEGKFYQLDIEFNSDSPDVFKVSSLEKEASKTGMTVTITELSKKVVGHKFEKLEEKLTQTFACYLYIYPNIKIMYNGYPLDPNKAIDDIQEYELQVAGVKGKHKLKIIDWKEIKSRQLFLCKSNGTVITEHTIEPYKVRNNGYSFSAYLISDYIDKLNSESALELMTLTDNGKSLISSSYAMLNEHFKNKKKQENLVKLDKWKSEGIYPFEENDDIGAVESVKRDIFDMIATKVEDNLPKFDKADTATKKFTFKLLSQAVQDNPKSMQKIINEVLNLSTEEKDDFANLLNKTSLTAIIKSTQIVADRLDFLEGLEQLVFNNKNELLERDQLHKILDNEAWIFDENFSLAGSEKRLEEVLDIHLKKLGKREEDEEVTDNNVLINGKKQGRVDLMLSKSIEVRHGYKDFLVVELKRPNKKIDMEVFGQIMGYAQAIQNDERFDKSKCQWKFIAVSNKLDSTVEMMANSKERPKGCVHNGDGLIVYTMTWAEVINNAKARLTYLKEQLKYEATDETSLAYLHKVHNKFIPPKLQEEE